MIAILLCIICSAALMLIFKQMGRVKADVFPAIIINYIICIAMGAWLSEGVALDFSLLERPWFPFAALLGLLFLGMFNLLSFSTQRKGVTVTTVAHKMSVVVPVVLAFFLYGERFGPVKIGGVLLALGAMYFTSLPPSGELKVKSSRFHMLLPVLVFTGGGIIDSTLKYAQHNHVGSNSFNAFLLAVFATSFVFGIVILIGRYIKQGFTLSWRDFAWGLALGIPNYASIYFMMEALENSGLESSAIFPLVNIGVITFSSFAAFVLFQEKISRINLLGIVLAIAAIILIALSQNMGG